MSRRQGLQLLGSLILLFGFVSGSWFLWLFGGFFLFMAFFMQWWQRRLPRLLTLSWEADSSKVMPHTPVHIRFTVVNHSWLPLPCTRCTFSLPEHVRVEEVDEQTIINKRSYVRLWFNLPRRSKVVRNFTLIPQSRGLIWLSDVQLVTLPLFLDDACELSLPLPFHLLVYPRIQAVPAFQLGDSQPTGRHLSRQRVEEDHTFLRGVRPYVAGDRLKHIDWKASAKTGSLQTRQYEYTAQPNWKVIGHILPSYEPLQHRHNDEQNEQTISILASLAVKCRREALAYELFINVRYRGKDGYHLAKGSGKSHHLQVMTHLARLHYYIPTPIVTVLRRLEQSRDRQAIVLVSPRLDDDVEEAVKRLLQRGHHVTIIDSSAETAQLRRTELHKQPKGDRSYAQ